MPQSTISGDLIAAYRSAEYRVESGMESSCGAITLRIDQHSGPLLSLLAASGHQCAAFITACNPHSVPRSSRENLAECARLRARLDRQLQGQPGKAGQIIEGLGCDSTGTWPAERSFLVLGLDLATSQALGREFGQNAIVWAGSDAIPRLILLR